MSDEISRLFGISLKKPVCIPGISEDALRQLVEALLVSVTDPDFAGFVRSTNGTEVKFVFGPDGNFSGVTAKLNGKNVTLISGAGSAQLGVFKGAPSSQNPGVGWNVEVDLTREFLNQPSDQTQWRIFYASRIGVLNTLLS